MSSAVRNPVMRLLLAGADQTAILSYNTAMNRC